MIANTVSVIAKSASMNDKSARIIGVIFPSQYNLTSLLRQAGRVASVSSCLLSYLNRNYANYSNFCQFLLAFRSKMKISRILFCILLTYLYLCTVDKKKETI